LPPAAGGFAFRPSATGGWGRTPPEPPHPLKIPGYAIAAFYTLLVACLK